MCIRDSIDGLDNDCDGEIDEDTLGADDDGDGFSEVDGDCDDTDDSVFPGADPVDGVTNADCDGVEDPASGDETDETDETDDTGDAEDTGDPDEAEDTGVDEGDTGDVASPEDDPPDGNDEDDAPTDNGSAEGVVGTDEKHSGCSHTPQAPPLWLLTLPLAGLVTRRRS